MHVYFHIFGRDIPAYGLMIFTGILLANIIGLLMVKKDKRDIYDLVLIEGYAVLGGFGGAKLLFIIVSFNDIDWSRVFGDLDYFNSVIGGGFVFYGGLIGGLIAAILCCRIHKIDMPYFFTRYIFLIPFIHSFGRVGCFCAGCCYGVPYDGPLAVVFPEGSYAIPGIKLFPVQAVEAAGLMIIALIVLLLALKFRFRYTVEAYLFLYAILRFILENYRYDEARGIYFGLSTSQWISILMAVTAIVSVAIRIRKPSATTKTPPEVATS